MFNEVVTKQSAQLFQVKKDHGSFAAVHSFAEEECAAFVNHINRKLSDDPDLAYLLPVSTDDVSELFSVVVDGVVLAKLINVAVPETIDERTINLQPSNRFHITENQNLALAAAKSIGLKVVNIGAGDIMEGVERPHLILGLVWQIVKMSLLANINLKANPNLIVLLQPGETLEALLKLPPEKLLLRWFNYHLEKAGCSRRVNNFGPDLVDSECYATLLKQIDPEKIASTRILADADQRKRATYVVSQGERMGAEFAIAPADILAGNDKLNLGFVAALFNACPGLEPPSEEESALMGELPEEDEGDSREERAFRMWINSLGLESQTFVHNLFDDLRDGRRV